MGHHKAMNSIGPIAISGLNAAATRIGVAANNLVNARSGAPARARGETLGAVYRPQQVAQSTPRTGGVTTTLSPVSPAFFVTMDRASPTGFSAQPNVDVGAVLVNLTLAASSYKAAARLLPVEAELSHALIDIVS